MLSQANEWLLVISHKAIVKLINTQRDIDKVFNIRGKRLSGGAFVGQPKNTPLEIHEGQLQRYSGEYKEVYGKHEEKKVRWIMLVEPTLPQLVALYQKKDQMDLAHESLAQIMFHAIDQRSVAVEDEYSSLIIGGISQARGGVENMHRINGHLQNIHILRALGEPGDLEEYSPSTPYSLLVFASKIIDTERILSFFAENAAAHAKKAFSDAQAHSLEKPVSNTQFLDTFDFLVYHPSKDALLALFNALMENKNTGLLDLRELFYREYPDRIGGLHPEMTKSGHSGFILTGTFFNMPFQQV
ncbi:hypothetical protein NECID01_1706 [Nematocida sp. AWRm77]|nr:hypothetical protein NECID01_1706 [Nematocida sp. AWRm77]